MKTKLLLFLFPTTLILSSLALVGGVERKLTTEDQRKLFECFFSSPYQYMFYQAEEPVFFNGKEYGVFGAGVNGILFYGDLERCAESLMEETKGKVSNDAYVFDRLSGIPAFFEKANGFKRVNPAIVEWGAENLIPNPKDQLGDYTYQQVYNRVFSRFFRLMTKTRLHLMNYKDLEEEKQLYLDAADKGQYMVNYLNNRFSRSAWLAEEEMPEDGTAWTVPMGYGFWLRREINGSGDALWEALQTLMKTYDKDWFKQTSKRMNGAAFKQAATVEGPCNACDCETWVYVDPAASIMLYSSNDGEGQVLEEVIPSSGNEENLFVALYIIGYDDGWFKVDNVLGAAEEIPLETTLWVKSNDLMSATRGYGGRGVPAYTQATQKSPLVGYFGSEQEGKVSGCRGQYLLFEALDMEGKPLKGWLSPDDQCPSPITTCP